MVQYYMLIVGLLISCNIIPFEVSAIKIDQLELKIEEMKIAERMLKTQHLGLAEKFSKLKKECEDQKRGLDVHDQLELRNKEELRALYEMKKILHEKQAEEEILEKALNIQYVHLTKYRFQMELLHEHHNILTTRRNQGLAEKCHKLEPLFEQNVDDPSVRSLAVVDKDTIITLRNTLNLHILNVQKLQDKNKLLRQETESYRKLCHQNIQDLKEVNILAEEETNVIRRYTTLAKKELSEVVKSIENSTKHIKEIELAIEILRGKALKLHKEIKTFSKDEDCYKKISELNLA